MQHADFTLLDGYLLLDDVDLLLSLYCLALDLLDELVLSTLVNTSASGRRLGVEGVMRDSRCQSAGLGALTFCKASFGIDIFSPLSEGSNSSLVL